MEIFKAKNLTFTYSQGNEKALDNVDFSVRKGELLCICGKSGCGKTTLLRLLKKPISPCGNISGSIEFCQKPISEMTFLEQSAKVGFVMQNAENQIVTDKVWHELAFGLESLGMPTVQIRKRVAEIAAFFGLDDIFYKDISQLSGGQKRLLTLASVMVMSPEVLILDEPTSQLDPIAATDFLNMLHKINQELGTTIILAEQRLEEVFSLCDRVVVLDKGKVLAEGAPEEVGTKLKQISCDLQIGLPTPMRVFYGLEDDGKPPLNVKDGRCWLENYKSTHDCYEKISEEEGKESFPCVVIKDVWFRYEKELPDVLKGLNLTVNEGEIFSVVGGNGNGKTTLLSVISGVNHSYCGDVRIKGKSINDIDDLYTKVIGLLPQNPCSLFTQKTVLEELYDVLCVEKDEQEKKAVFDYYVDLCDVKRFFERNPYDLSGGEQQRVALCKVLLKNPEILLLDEPTKGFDAQFKAEFKEMLLKLKKSGKTVIMVSHDVEFCASVSDRCGMLFAGEIVSVAKTREFFCENMFYTTSANRMARGILENVILAEDIVRTFGKKLENKKACEVVREEKEILLGDEKKEVIKPLNKKEKSTKNYIFSVLFLLLAVPLTVLLGGKYFGEQRYYFVSLLVILETLIPFFATFERRKPSARELVIISVFCAFAVVGRIAFSFVPQIKPTLAVILLSGVCLGGEAGFMVGAVTAFVSNFFFGQGPWTPWQMLVMGIAGFLAGVIFNKSVLKKSRFILAFCGFFITTFIYGVIMNVATLLMMQQPLTWEGVVTVCTLGFPLDVIHGLSSFVFLWLIGKPMVEKLERIKNKYGL